LGGRPLGRPVSISVKAGAQPPTFVKAGFPKGLFLDVSDADDLSPSSTLLEADAGLIVGEAALEVVDPRDKVLDFEDSLLGLAEGTEEPFLRLERFPRELRPDAEFRHLIDGGAPARRRDAVELPTDVVRFMVAEVVRG
ncbi:MAG: hypothetical protein ABIR82_11505, partial [Nocardioides sp.]